ncbi:hypothetical protein HON71_03325 [Candidatus Woesearchaeota archaeon]|nr:hypothetical protein [Candidatus Woesearchaeota archaeon]
MIYNKKGMGVGQVFVFIVAALTFALIMIFGYQTISKIIISGEEVAFVQFKTDLEDSVKKIYTEFGAIRIEKFFPPEKFEHICFVNMNYDFSVEEKEALCKENPLACDVLDEAQLGVEEGRCFTGYDCVEKNIFFKPQSTVAIKVYQISLADSEGEEEFGFLCKKIIQGTFSLGLEGKGDHTELFDVK